MPECVAYLTKPSVLRQAQLRCMGVAPFSLLPSWTLSFATLVGFINNF